MNPLHKAAQQALEALEYAQQGRECPSTTRQAITALRAALAQQAEPDLSRCPQCNGPADNGFDRSFPPSPYLCKKCMAEPVGPGAWVASKDGRVIYDDASTDDDLLRVSGDFENDEQRSRYAQRIVDKLNAALAQQAEPVEPVGWNWMLDGQPYGQAYYGNPPDTDIAERAAIAGRTVRLLYTAPPQRKPLTKEQFLYIYNQLPNWGMDMDSLPQGLEKFGRAIERAHGIKE